MDRITATNPSNGLCDTSGGAAVWIDLVWSSEWLDGPSFGCSWTMETPTNNMKSDSHWSLMRVLLSINTENSAVVRIFSWYVTFQRNEAIIKLLWSHVHFSFYNYECFKLFCLTVFKGSLIVIATQMITEPGPESCIKNRVDNKKINCMLVDKKVSVEKKNNNNNNKNK